MLHTPPLGLNFVPKFLSMNAEIKVPQYHKSIYQTKMGTAGAYHMHPPNRRVQTIVVPLDLDLIYHLTL